MRELDGVQPKYFSKPTWYVESSKMVHASNLVCKAPLHTRSSLADRYNDFYYYFCQTGGKAFGSLKAEQEKALDKMNQVSV